MGTVQPIDPHAEVRAQLLARLRVLCDHLEMFPGDMDWVPHEAHTAVREYLTRTGDLEVAALFGFLLGQFCARCDYRQREFSAQLRA